MQRADVFDSLAFPLDILFMRVDLLHYGTLIMYLNEEHWKLLVSK